MTTMSKSNFGPTSGAVRVAPVFPVGKLIRVSNDPHDNWVVRPYFMFSTEHNKIATKEGENTITYWSFWGLLDQYDLVGYNCK